MRVSIELWRWLPFGDVRKSFIVMVDQEQKYDDDDLYAGQKGKGIVFGAGEQQ